jgi:hypothetical protein
VLLLGWSFFGLSSEMRTVLLDEIYYLIRYSNFSYNDLMKIPTYERKYFVDKLVEEFQKKSEAMEKAKSKR